LRFPLDDYRCLLSDQSRLLGQLNEHRHFRAKAIGVERLEPVVRRAAAAVPYYLDVGRVRSGKKDQRSMTARRAFTDRGCRLISVRLRPEAAFFKVYVKIRLF
jgi:hypothetical protein